MITTNVELITPEIASEYLAHNGTNRNVRQKHVEALARDIIDDKFYLTHQGIAFFENGNLADGQHRLLAIIKANKPVMMQVTRGLSPDAMDGVDFGSKRDARDVFKLHDEFADSVIYRNSHMQSAIRRLVYSAYNARMTLSVSELRKLMIDLAPNIEVLYRVFGTRRRNPGADFGAAVLAASICGETEPALYEFCEAYQIGRVTKDYNSIAAINWANYIMRASINKKSLVRPAVYLGTQNAIWNFIHSDNSLVRIPKNPRYDVKERIGMILKPEGSSK